MRIFLLIFLFNINIVKLNAQMTGEELYLFNAKRLALSKGLHQRDSLIKRIDELRWSKLSSTGFENVVFYLVYDSIELIDIDGSELNIDSLKINNLLYGYCEFVFAVNTRTKNTYRLKGYDFIDFVDFYYTEILDNKPNRKLSKKEMLNKFNIERIDLDCLFDYYIITSKKKRQISCYKCIDKNKPIYIY